MSYQIISKMRYNAETRQIEFWQKSNNVTGSPYFSTIGTSDDELFRLINLRAQNAWQGRKWSNVFDVIFTEFPSLRYWLTRDDERRGLSWKEYCEVGAGWDAETLSNKSAIVARFRELAKIA